MLQLFAFVLVLIILATGTGTNSVEENILSTSEEPRPLSVVSLKQERYFSPNEYAHFCTGTILSKEWILTAGHCFTDKHKSSVDRIVVDVGSEFIANGTHYPISEWHIHPNQSESIQIYRNDLCLVKLQKPINFTGNIQSVRFGTIEDQKELPVLAGGWGRTSQSGALNKKLRLVHLKTMKFDECKKIHARRNNLIDTDTQICASGGLGNTLCFGDSGGPMFDECTGYQVATFSSLEDCSGEYPVLFMRIERFHGWIKDVTKLDLTLD